MSPIFKEIFIYATEILPSKSKLIRPRIPVGTHLEYESGIREGRLRFHLERNLNTINPDRNYIIEVTENVFQDFAELAGLLTSDPALAGVTVLEGITNFQDRTGRRYGFESTEIITHGLLCLLFDNRIDKPFQR